MIILYLFEIFYLSRAIYINKMIYECRYLNKARFVIVLYLVKIKEPMLTCQYRYGRKASHIALISKEV